jgi:hypothetical protein
MVSPGLFLNSYAAITGPWPEKFRLPDIADDFLATGRIARLKPPPVEP